MNSGIYGFWNDDNSIVYIGKSKNIRARKNAHFQALRRGSHYNSELQAFYNAYLDRLEFRIIDKCPVSYLSEREQYFIDLFRPVCNKQTNVIRCSNNPDKDSYDFGYEVLTIKPENRDKIRPSWHKKVYGIG